MTETSSFPPKAIHAPASAHVLPPSTYTVARHQHYHAPADPEPVEPVEETIHCICGFSDDDGWTVACDECNRWQHQSCYYPQYDERQMPADMQHACVECKPRPVDWQRAQQRQREKRLQQEPQTNGVKRNATKSHKKKIKEPGTAHTNGWPVDKLRHDRNSASPRDQPPPAKRPKTSHRTSDSTTTTTKGHSRKRNASSATHRRSLSRSPDSPIEQYSEEFLRCYQEDDWVVTYTNLHNSIAITSALSEWLGFSEEEFREHHNQAKGEVLMRWDGDLDEIPGKAQLDILEARDDTIQYNGEHPTWKMLTVKEPIAEGAYIGELKGHVGFKKDYQSDGANRWAQLRHPEPFVFFHPKLPIYIDSRNEGTELRYVRRSCQPNARLQILVTDNVDYHFCFMATTQIDPGVEISVGWDTNDGMPELIAKSRLSGEELDGFSAWVSTALANCGPCACQLHEHDCYFHRFDRRRRGVLEEAQQTKPKSKKRKANHISPINTNALNSRSGSEARKVDPDDDGTDSRSTSGSAGRGSASRDITPNTHYSTNGTSSTLPELSERERKKLAKEEEIFRRQEEERVGKQAKKKRNSAGSSLNTPSATSSKQLGFPPTNSKYVDAGNSRQSGLPAKTMSGRKPKTQKVSSRPPSRTIKRVRPIYVEHEVQCDLDAEEAQQRAPTPSSRRPYLTMRQRLIELCARNNSTGSDSVSNAATPTIQTAPLLEKMPTANEPASSSSPKPSPQPNTSDDVDMADAPGEEDKASSPVDVKDNVVAAQDDASKSSPAVDLSATKSTSPAVESKTGDMHLQMPPPPANPFSQAVQPLSAGSPTTTTNNVVQSPATLGTPSIFSPSVSAAVAPSPAKKKLSLSDYTRRKAKDKDVETSKERDSSPASTNSGPVVPPLRPSSSAEARAAEGGSAIDEDVKMEDASDAPAIKA
ncbi:hypothetical protein M409DRAFT_69413 [Zasmidium cellare ATCC 36951]|uniref:SET domain-containing protein n=1 Tax=Zasmidium cellare ATCC 36951 TaxID=1080233 RepID=A0A6A6C4C0_ZASCE|nr:uncharacterized protein M409DRAFT_69413 [Zasmidium cellare ATCC 36951]KAF2161871.1 hypothetical protein M409DRAFT_69413 [Zasmidium cellare ATCC 36951]